MHGPPKTAEGHFKLVDTIIYDYILWLMLLASPDAYRLYIIGW